MRIKEQETRLNPHEHDDDDDKGDQKQRSFQDLRKARLEVTRKKGKGHPCTGTEALYRPYGPKGE